MAASSSVEEEEEETLMEEREEVQMVSPSGGKPSWRVAHFLKPSLPSSQELPPISQTLIFSSKPLPPYLQSLSSKINFHGWRCPQRKWFYWVEKLRPSFEPIWKKSSIFESIMASTIKIPRCRDTIFALAERFCPETNSFLLPWGEVAITLEDVLVLGGYSVTGASVLSELDSKELLEIEEKLLKECRRIARSKHKRSSQSPWMDAWMENGSGLEHEAFLSLWLSRYVLPGDCFDTINKNVFQIAILLARGTKIAIGPAVLASIYRDLRLLKAYIGTLSLGDRVSVDGDVTKLKLLAPLQYLQVWAWERFPTLSPKPNAMTHGLPRLARWNKVKILRVDDVGSAIDSAKGSFGWRPYTTPLNNWSCCAKIYPEKAMWVSVGSETDLDLQSYARCIRVSELVGLDSVQQYLPHRVAMQFGFDQDVPFDVPRFTDSWETAWGYYNRPIRDVRLYMPSRLFESDVTTRYLEWWKSKIEKETVNCVKLEDTEPADSLFKNTPKGLSQSAQRLRITIENNGVNVLPGFESFDPKRKRVVADISPHQPSSKQSKGASDAHGMQSDRNGANASCRSSQVKVVEIEDDSDSDLDHLPLSQLFRHMQTKRENRGTISPCHSQIPLPSPGDNMSVRRTKSTTSPSPHPTSSNMKQLGRSSEETHQSAEVDLKDRILTEKSTELDLGARISRLQRIIGYFSHFMQTQRTKCSK